jgi:leader peptidase (prepilin peptidase) / N-methyltransferase
MTLAEIAAAASRGGSVPVWLVRVFVVAWGCIWGSFVNVVIHRVPRELNIAYPGSSCPACGAPVRAIDNVPVVSWLLLRGRARCCGAQISPRYVVVELLSGLLALAIFEVAVRPLDAGTSVVHAGALFLADFALAMALLAASFIDAEHMYLPDAITIGGTLFGLATPGLRGLTWPDALLGAAIGFLGVWLPFIVAYKALRGRPGMGLGDAKLVMLAGAWFGWPGAVFSVFAGAIQATLAAGTTLLVRGKIEEPESVRRDREAIAQAAAAGDLEAKRAIDEDPLATAPADGVLAARLPFGPFLCIAIIEWMLAGSSLRDRWMP